jgi:hypothetical protein
MWIITPVKQDSYFAARHDQIEVVIYISQRSIIGFAIQHSVGPIIP